MKYCFNCGNPVEENAKFCHNCGTALYQAEGMIYGADPDRMRKVTPKTVYLVSLVVFLIACAVGVFFLATKYTKHKNNTEVINSAEITEASKKISGNIKFKDIEGNILLDENDIEALQPANGTSTDTDITTYFINIRFTEEGTAKFAKATEENIGRVIYIYVDDEIVSCPMVNSAITGGNASIEFSMEEERDRIYNTMIGNGN